MPLLRKFHGRRPTSRKKAKPFSLLGLPAGGFTFKKKLKTTVKIAMVASGLTSDHVHPSTERLYLERSSRNVRLAIRSREAESSARELIGLPPSDLAPDAPALGPGAPAGGRDGVLRGRAPNR